MLVYFYLPTTVPPMYIKGANFQPYKCLQTNQNEVTIKASVLTRNQSVFSIKASNRHPPAGLLPGLRDGQFRPDFGRYFCGTPDRLPTEEPLSLGGAPRGQTAEEIGRVGPRVQNGRIQLLRRPPFCCLLSDERGDESKRQSARGDE